MATDAQQRHDEVDAERVAHMRDLLSRPGGEAEVARRYGSEAEHSDEFRAAKRQQKASTDRAREARAAAAKDAADKAAQARQAAWPNGRSGGNNEAQSARWIRRTRISTWPRGDPLPG